MLRLIKNHSRSHELSFRLALTTVFFSMLIALLVSGAQIYHAYQQGVESARMRMINIESTYAPSLAAGLWEVNALRVDALMDAIAQIPDVSFVQLTDDAGMQWLRHTAANEKPWMSRSFALVYEQNNRRFAVGTLYVEMTGQYIFNNLVHRALSIAITTFTTLLLSTALILWLFQRWVTQHLERMAQFAQELDLNKLDTALVLNRTPRSKPDELDMVVTAINNMRLTLQDDLAVRSQIEDELRRHKYNLEELVQRRTAELQDKNAQLERQSTEVEAQNRELDAYAHSVAHDLKTPLTTIIGRAQLLNAMGGSLTPQQVKESHASIHRTALKMANIINALLLLASVRREDDVRTDLIQLKPLAQEACERVNHHKQEANATIEFVGQWLPAIGYDQWVEEVWVNYISNAIKYGGAPPLIEIGCTPLNNGFNKYWVRDHGNGVARHRQGDLFVEFSRITPTTTAEGHGLGLSIVKRIIDRLRGEVGYEQATSGGSIFWFTLPAPANQQIQQL